MNSLSNGTTTIVLPIDLTWIDEFAWAQVAQTKSYTLTGALVLESAVKLKGRPITLGGGGDRFAWISRADLLALLVWRALPAQALTLIVRAEAARTVRFDHEAGAIEATPIVDYSDIGAADFYSVILRFIEV